MFMMHGTNNVSEYTKGVRQKATRMNGKYPAYDIYVSATQLPGKCTKRVNLENQGGALHLQCG